MTLQDVNVKIIIQNTKWGKNPVVSIIAAFFLLEQRQEMRLFYFLYHLV